MKNKPLKPLQTKNAILWLRSLTFLTCMFIMTLPILAQTKSVSGKVIDQHNEPLIGVSVVVQGTSNGVITDLDGHYILSVAPGAKLEFSYVGMAKQVIQVGTQSTINVTLKDDVTVLTETVVIGYGSAKKADLTGSIGSVNSDAISKQPSLNATQAIQGKIAGINIINNDEPGSSPSVIVRGLGTALGGRNPLYIVDGFPVDNIDNISPSDISSMDILKDASSASIYGVRAANGVILITTKKGILGKPKVTFDSYIGMKNILHKVEMANASQYIQYFNENQETLSSSWTLASADEQLYNTDWYDALTDVGYFNNNLVSVSGGSETTNYFLSYNFYNEDGILKDQTYNRHTLRDNNVYKLFGDRLKLSQSLSLTYTKEKPKPSSAFNDAYRQSPLVPIKYSNGRYGMPYVNQTTGIVTYEQEDDDDVIGSLNSIGNPVYTVKSTNELTNTFTIQGGLEAEFKINNYLKFNTRLGATKYFSKTRSFVNIKDNWLNADPTRTEDEFATYQTDNPTVTTYADNSLGISKTETLRWNWENFLTFSKDFNKHHLDATLGASCEKINIGDEMGVTAYGVPEKEQYWNANLASDDYTKEINQTSYTPTALASYFGRAQYNYDNKYYVTGTIRRDGTSTFKDSGEYWGTFPSFGFGWTISKENFFNNFLSIDYLKLRGSWGELGNQDVPLNVSQILTSTGSANYNYVLGSSQDLVYGAAYGTPAVNLTWEVTREWSLGADFSLFDFRLSGNVDYYNKKNKNTILYVSPTLDSQYADNYYAHGASVVNKGLELSLSWKDNLTKDLSYEIGVNYSLNNNKVTSVKTGYDGATGGSLSNGQITKRLKVGQPLYSWWMYEADGVWQNQTEIDEAEATLGTPLPGYLKYKDQNSDGVIDTNDKKYLGSYVPTYNYGVHLALKYKDIDFNVDGYGVGGNKIYNGLKGTRIDGGENIAYETYKNRWTGDGSTNKNPGAARDSYASSYYLESGAFFRINNITVGYTLDKLLANKVRLYLTAQNPFIFTKYTGFSPEIAGSNSGSPSETAGIEISAYPTTKNFIFGVNIQF